MCNLYQVPQRNELIEITPTQDLWVPKKPAATTERATLI
jgi:hypothetical protein